MTRDERRRVAFHEAGHAVFHTMHGDLIDRVTIVPGRDYAGQVTFQESSSSGTFSRLMCLLAGPAAEAVFSGGLDLEGAHDDLRQMINLVATNLSADEETRSAIDWVAQALLVKKKLTGDEVRSVMQQAARWKVKQRNAIAKITGRGRLFE